MMLTDVIAAHLVPALDADGEPCVYIRLALPGELVTAAALRQLGERCIAAADTANGMLPTWPVEASRAR